MPMAKMHLCTRRRFEVQHSIIRPLLRFHLSCMHGAALQRSLTVLMFFQLRFKLQCAHRTDFYTCFTAIAVSIVYLYPRPDQLDGICGADRNARSTISTSVSIYFYLRLCLLLLFLEYLALKCAYLSPFLQPCILWQTSLPAGLA